jgi:hypothetical protein
MSGPTQSGLSTDPGKINPTGANPEALSEYQNSLEAQIKSLEDRYSSPNWFKVAAGFAKPQLGGFVASLGSAAEAMGENVEAGRAAALPIAQMRSQLAQSRILTQQNKEVSDEITKWQKDHPNETPTPGQFAIWASKAPDLPAVKSLMEQQDLSRKQQSLNVDRAKVVAELGNIADKTGADFGELLRNTQLFTNDQIDKIVSGGAKAQLGKDPLSTTPLAPVTTMGAAAPETNPAGVDELTLKVLPNGARVTPAQMQLVEAGIPIISGHRTQAEQDALKDHKDQNGAWVTKQGLPIAEKSQHLSGNAIDVDYRKITPDQIAYLKAQGYTQPEPSNDPGHWQLASTMAAKPQAAKQIDWADPNYPVPPAPVNQRLPSAAQREQLKTNGAESQTVLNNLSGFAQDPNFEARRENLFKTAEMLSDPVVREFASRGSPEQMSSVIRAALTSSSVPDFVKNIVDKGNFVTPRDSAQDVAKFQRYLQALSAESTYVNNLVKNPTNQKFGMEMQSTAQQGTQPEAAFAHVMEELHKMQRITQMPYLLQPYAMAGYSPTDMLNSPRLKSYETDWTKVHRQLPKYANRYQLPLNLSDPEAFTPGYDYRKLKKQGAQ